MHSKKMSKGDISKERIIKSALEIIARRSFDDASLVDIAKNSGTTQTNILYHFKNKKILLSAVIQYVLEEGRANIDRPYDPKLDAYQRMKEYVYRQINWASKNRNDFAVISYLYYLATRSSEYKSLYTEVQQTARKRVLELLLAGKRENIFTFQESNETMSIIIHDHLLGSIVNFVTTAGPKEEPTQTKKQWDRLLKTLLFQ